MLLMDGNPVYHGQQQTCINMAGKLMSWIEYGQIRIGHAVAESRPHKADLFLLGERPETTPGPQTIGHAIRR